MTSYYKVIILFLVICFLKFIINFYKFTRTKYLLKKYKAYIKNPEWDFAKYKSEIIQLFKNAGIKDSGANISEHVGHGTLKTQTISTYDNLVNQNKKVVNIVTNKFYVALGYYKLRFCETINPLYWIEFFVFFPKNILKYFGVEYHNFIVKIFQLIYWFFGLSASINALFDFNIFNFFSQLKLF